jgi:hypothetical protein
MGLGTYALQIIALDLFVERPVLSTCDPDIKRSYSPSLRNRLAIVHFLQDSLLLASDLFQ